MAQSCRSWASLTHAEPAVVMRAAPMRAASTTASAVASERQSVGGRAAGRHDRAHGVLQQLQAEPHRGEGGGGAHGVAAQHEVQEARG